MKNPSPDKAAEVATSVCIGEPSDLSLKVGESMLEAVRKERRARFIRRASTAGVAALLMGVFFLFQGSDRSTSSNPVAASQMAEELSPKLEAPRAAAEEKVPQPMNIAVFSTADLELSVNQFKTADVDIIHVPVFDDAAAMAWCQEQRIGYGFIRLGGGEKRFVVAEVID